MASRSAVFIALAVTTLLITIGLFWLLANRSNISIQLVDNGSDRPFDFYAKVVDQNGRPLKGVVTVYTIDRFRSNWALSGNMNGRGENICDSVKSDVEGNVRIHGDGHGLFFTSLMLDGYSRLFDKFPNDDHLSPGKWAIFHLYTRGQKLYEPDPNRPAIFVMVKDGVKIAATLPSVGGSDPPTRLGGPRIVLQPVWPNEPSIAGIEYVPCLP